MDYNLRIRSCLQFPALREFVRMGKAVWGTCAGLIFLANKAVGGFPSFNLVYMTDRVKSREDVNSTK